MKGSECSYELKNDNSSSNTLEIPYYPPYQEPYVHYDYNCNCGCHRLREKLGALEEEIRQFKLEIRNNIKDGKIVDKKIIIDIRPADGERLVTCL